MFSCHTQNTLLAQLRAQIRDKRVQSGQTQDEAKMQASKTEPSTPPKERQIIGKGMLW